MSASTKDILIEITSSDSMDICKKVMDELVVEMIAMGITSTSAAGNGLVEKVEALSVNSESSSSSSSNSAVSSSAEEQALADDPNSKLRHTLIMQQVRIIDSKGALKTVYPSRVDLCFGESNKLRVVRCYDD